MRRFAIVVLSILLLSMTAAPVHVAVTTERVALVAHVAEAADCVKLGAPILSGKNEVCDDGAGGGPIVSYVKMILQFLAGGIGLVIILMLVIAGIQYITSVGDPTRVKAAKDRIINAMTALMLFVLGYAILNFLIPGGIIG